MALSPNINVMLRAAEKAGRSLRRDFGEVEQLQVSKKGPGDFVSAADIRAEEIIYEELSKARPDYAFLMEESGKKGPADSPYTWIIDPLDGTSNFLHGIPHWCISIALEHENDIIAGIIYDPIKEETFRAEKGNGAFIMNKRLRVSGRRNLEEAMVACGQPKRDPVKQQLFMAEYSAMLAQTGGVRRYGAAALDLAYVAAGRYEAFWEEGLKAWDMAAGYLIVKEASGRVTDISGTKNPVHERNILATNMDLYEPIKAILHKTRKQQNAA